MNLDAVNLDLGAPGLSAAAERLGPYGKQLLARAADRALSIHADDLTPEHLLVALLEDETSAAHRIVLHAFADPETLAIETLATAPGILVVGSERTIPFSVLGVEALERARRTAHDAGAAEVEPAHLLAGAAASLPDELGLDLAAAGYVDPEPDSEPGSGPGPEPGPGATPALPLDGALFKHFARESRRLLVLAARTATRLDRASVAPAHLVLACLEADTQLARRAGLTASAARRAIGGRDDDTTPVTARRLPPGEGLLELLEALPEGADSVDLLAAYLTGGAPEIRELFRRHLVTAELVERGRGAFRDELG